MTKVIVQDSRRQARDVSVFLLPPRQRTSHTRVETVITPCVCSMRRDVAIEPFGLI
jgi:hypothetical protein